MQRLSRLGGSPHPDLPPPPGVPVSAAALRPAARGRAGPGQAQPGAPGPARRPPRGERQTQLPRSGRVTAPGGPAAAPASWARAPWGYGARRQAAPRAGGCAPRCPVVQRGALPGRGHGEAPQAQPGTCSLGGGRPGRGALGRATRARSRPAFRASQGGPARGSVRLGALGEAGGAAGWRAAGRGRCRAGALRGEVLGDAGHRHMDA